MKKASLTIKFIFIISLIILIIVFSFQNMNKVSIHFLKLQSIDIPMFMFIFVLLAAGVIIGYMIGLISGSKISEKKLKKMKIDTNQKAIDTLKSPLKNS